MGWCQDLKVENSAVNWASAQEEFRKQSGFGAQDIRSEFASKIGQAVVPVRIPEGLLDSFGGSGFGPDGTPRCSMSNQPDGYTLNCAGKSFDTTVDAYTSFVRVSEAPLPEESNAEFSEELGGAIVTLRADGVAYTLTFTCTDPKFADELNEESGNCIRKDDAIAIAESLVIVGGRELQK